MVTYTNSFSVFIIVSFFSVNNAFGFCSAPIAPEPPGVFAKPTKPMVPFCVNEIVITHIFSDWEISSYDSELSSYRSDIDFYVQKLKNYISEAKYFLNETVAYAKCEISTLD